MAFDLHQLIATIRPEIFCSPASRRQVKRILDSSKANGLARYSAAAELARPAERNIGNVNVLLDTDPLERLGLECPCERHEVVFDSLSDSPERVYFRFLDVLEHAGWEVEKLGDIMNGSAGSDLGHQLDEGLLKSREHATRLFRSAEDTLSRLLRNLDDLRVLDKERPRLAELDNESSKVTPAIPPESGGSSNEVSLSQRSLLVASIRSQVAALKAYARWLRPYLEVKKPRLQGGECSADLVNAFNTTVFRVELLATNDGLLQDEFDQDNLPSWLTTKKHRRAVPVLVIEASFRTVPDRDRGGGFHHRGRIHVTLTSYALRDDESRLLHQLIRGQDFHNLTESIGIVDVTALEALEEELSEVFLESDKRSPPTKPDDPNPFKVLCGIFRRLFSEDQERVPTNPDDIHLPLTPDSFPEQVIRSRSLLVARRNCLELYEALKAQWTPST